MKTLNGSELAGYIKERQAKEVRRLKQANGITPALAIVQDHPDPVIDTYVRLKVKYGQDLGIITDVYAVKPTQLADTIGKLNKDKKYQGIIIQLPLDSSADTASILNQIEPAKDVDGLSNKTVYTPATAQAIMWLINGYDVELNGRKVIIVGQGRLVGAPLARLLREAGLEPIVLDETSTDVASVLTGADIVITATGRPGLIKSDMIKAGASVIDAGSASEGGQIKGDVDDGLYSRTDINLTPRRGGVGPLTVASLFDNLLRAARARITAP